MQNPCRLVSGTASCDVAPCLLRRVAMKYGKLMFLLAAACQVNAPGDPLPVTGEAEQRDCPFTSRESDLGKRADKGYGCYPDEDFTGTCYFFHEGVNQNGGFWYASANEEGLQMQECILKGRDRGADAVKLREHACDWSLKVYFIREAWCSPEALPEAISRYASPSPPAPGSQPEATAQPDSPSIDSQLPPGFVPEFYGASRPEVIAAYGADANAMKLHWINHGRHNGHCWNCFDALRYIASHGDLVASLGADGMAGVMHYFYHGFFEGRGLRFDCAAYAARNPDLAAAYGGDCYQLTLHYINHGYHEGRTY